MLLGAANSRMLDTTSSRPCGEAIIELLEDYGVDTVFGIPGVHTQEFYRGLSKNRIQHVLTRHEQGAGFMACGYARASGRPGVCVLITGPGVTNAATALGQGYADSLPVLLLSSENATHTLHKGYGELHEISDQSAVTKPLTGYNALAHSVAEVPDHISAAFESFTAGRPRPAHVAVPIDLLEQPVEGRWTVQHSRRSTDVEANQIKAAAALIANSSQPLVCVGGGAVDASAEVRALAERLGAPVLSSHAGKGVIPSGHPLNAGSAMHLAGGHALLSDSDTLIAIGTELAWTDSFVDELPIRGKIIRIDVDSSQFTGRYTTSVGVQADAKSACAKLLAELGEGVNNEADGRERAASAQTQNNADRTDLEKRHQAVLSVVRQMLPSNGILSTDTSQITYTGQADFPVDAPRQWLYGAGFCTLGGALPEAIGAALACPGQPVMAVAGDGGFMFTMPELATAAELKLSLPVLVWNNESLAQIKDGMVARGFKPTGVDSINPDFLAVGAAFGCATARPQSADELGESIRTALSAGRPTLIEVHQDDRWLVQ